MDTAIPITLGSDFDHTRERWVDKPMEFLTSVHLSADGDRLALTARGEVFTIPVESGGRLVNVPRQEGVRYREAAFLGEGKSLLALTDETGEIELAKLPANGLGASEVLTRDGGVFRMDPVAAPDGRWAAWQDKNRQLWVRDLNSAQSKLIATSLEDEFADLTWSPDSQWLAYVETLANTYRQIKLCRVVDGTILTATTDRVNSSGPAWSEDGQWLYFCSERQLRSLVASPWGHRQPEPFFTENTKLYALALRKGLRSPFEPPDELNPAPDQKEKGDKEKPSDKRDEAEPKDETKTKEPGSKEKAPPAPVVIEAEGLMARLWELPVPAGNYSGLTAAAKHLFFTARAPGFEVKPKLMRLEITPQDPKAKVFMEEVKSWELSSNRKKVLLRKDDSFYVVPAGGDAPAKLEKAVPLDRWSFSISPREEWRQIYQEASRMLRDHFYDAKLHGVDWLAIRQKYAPLIDRVTDREECDFHRVEGIPEMVWNTVQPGQHAVKDRKSFEIVIGGRRTTLAQCGKVWKTESHLKSEQNAGGTTPEPHQPLR